ncbi:MAG: HEPN domain-containing protein [Elusimicrobia bacterium]|nr:HEPN domain-containing protein [Elusimicrobiota bacterium]
MNAEFQDCLKRKKIQEFSRGEALIEKEIKTAGQDLASAKESSGSKNFKWSTIQSYYAMFHSARALLFLENFRGKKPPLSDNCA